MLVVTLQYLLGKLEIYMKISILSPLVFGFALFCASSAFAFDWKSETGEIVIPDNAKAA